MILRVEDLRLLRGAREVLRGVSFGVERGELIALLGRPISENRNGAIETLHFVVHRTSEPYERRVYALIGPDERVESFGPDDDR